MPSEEKSHDSYRMFEDGRDRDIARKQSEETDAQRRERKWEELIYELE